MMIDFKKCNSKKIKWKIENIVMVVMEYLQVNQVSALNNPWWVDMSLNKPNFIIFRDLFVVWNWWFSTCLSGKEQRIFLKIF